MIHLQGDKQLAASPAELWKQISNARSLAECVPGVEVINEATADQATCTIRPGFSFVRGTLNLSLQITQRTEATSVQVTLKSKGIGSSAKVEASISLTAHDFGTQLQWTAVINSLGGLLKAIPRGLIQASAQKVVEDALGKLEQRLVVQ
jgi:carbon monoxide dehydrogenase subunit G